MIDVRDFTVGLALSSGESLPVLRQINLSVKAGETVGLGWGEWVGQEHACSGDDGLPQARLASA